MIIDVHFDGRMIRLKGRTAQMVAWLVQRSEEIEGPEKIGLAFDCAGKSMHVEVKRRERYRAN